MTAVMGYADQWSVAPGDTLHFMVSCLEIDHYHMQLVRLKQPDAGPLATPFAPEPIDAPCNGHHSGRFQPIPVGSLAVVPSHPALALSGSISVVACIMPTTPAKGRQAIMGTWNDAAQTGFGLEIDADRHAGLPPWRRPRPDRHPVRRHEAPHRASGISPLPASTRPPEPWWCGRNRSLATAFCPISRSSPQPRRQLVLHLAAR